MAAKDFGTPTKNFGIYSGNSEELKEMSEEIWNVWALMKTSDPGSHARSGPALTGAGGSLCSSLNPCMGLNSNQTPAQMRNFVDIL